MAPDRRLRPTLSASRLASVEDHRSQVQFDRVVFFSDAVFAIAATLLVLDLRPPTTSEADHEAALRAYLSQPAPFIAVAVGFLVVGAYWMSHRRVFGLLAEPTSLVVWGNLVFLFFVAIQPFATAALADHLPTVTSVAVYAGVQVLTGVAQLLLWAALLWSPGALVPEATPRIRQYVSVQLARTPLIFLGSIPIAFIAGPAAAMVSWALVFVLGAAVARVFDNPEGIARRPSGPEQGLDGGPDPGQPAGVLGATGVEPVGGNQGSVARRGEGDVENVGDRDAASPEDVREEPVPSPDPR
jgi:uncharacterized membrane protein